VQAHSIVTVVAQLSQRNLYLEWNACPMHHGRQRAILVVPGERNRPSTMESSRDYTPDRLANARTAIELNSYSLAIPVVEYLELLVMSGAQLDQLNVDGACCDNCNGQLAIWWDHCNRLSIPERLYVQGRIRETHHNLPNGPWEDVTL
jgi:hypothetical protein